MNVAMRGRIILISVYSPGCVIDLYRPRMLLHDDVVSDGQAKASALSSGFCCEKWIEHLFPYFGRDARAIVANPNLNFLAEVLCRRRQGWLIAMLLSCSLRLVAA